MLFRRSNEPAILEIAFDAAHYRIHLKRHRQARRYTLRIHTATRDVVLTMPLRGTLKEARAFAEKHGGWIAARLGRLPAATPFAPNMMVPLRDIPHRIDHRPTARGTVWTEASADGTPLLCVAGGAAHVARRVTDFLKREARRELDGAAKQYAQRLSVRIARISIRDQASRWGSCSSTGALSFSWRLILAPPFVLDYLAAHEVAHLVEMNHSPRYWRLLGELCSETGRAKAWLEAHGAALHRYGLGADKSTQTNTVPV